MEYDSKNQSSNQTIRTYEWWDERARDETPLTADEEAVIYSCGGLRYLRTYGRQNGFDKAKVRSVSEKHYFDCAPNCVCGRNQKPFEWWEERARDPTPLTPSEQAIIYSCGGLSYLHTYGLENGFEAVKYKTVSCKYYRDCNPGCICGRWVQDEE